MHMCAPIPNSRSPVRLLPVGTHIGPGPLKGGEGHWVIVTVVGPINEIPGAFSGDESLTSGTTAALMRTAGIAAPGAAGRTGGHRTACPKDKSRAASESAAFEDRGELRAEPVDFVLLNGERRGEAES